MTPELTALALAALLQALQFVSFATLANRDLTPGYRSSIPNSGNGSGI